MKKLVLIAAIAFSVASASAQIFIGGNIGVNSNSDDFGTAAGIYGKDYSSLELGISPKVGYIINDKLSAGLQIGFTSGSTKVTEIAGNNEKAESSSSAFEVAPFVRYDALTFGKINLGLEAKLRFSSSSDKSKFAGVETKGPTITTFGLGVVPVLSYSLTEKFSLEAYLNFANLGFTSQTSKPDVGNKTTSTSFGLGVDATSAFTTGNLNIGFVYKF
jgi:outer membrane protein assembly factor BamA